MKSRSGFVSNSSSSSFCILGIILNGEENDLDCKGLCVNLEYGISNYRDEELIGAAPWEMKDHETFNEFKQRVYEDIKKVYPKVKLKDISWLSDGGYDG